MSPGRKLGYTPPDIFSVLLYHGRISHSNRPFRNVLGHHGACANYAVAADVHARQNCDIAADPHVIADVYRFFIRKALSAHRRSGINRLMIPRIYSAMRTHHHVVADVGRAANGCSNADAGSVAQGNFTGESRLVLNVDILTTMDKDELPAESSEPLLTDVQWEKGNRQVCANYGV